MVAKNLDTLKAWFENLNIGPYICIVICFSMSSRVLMISSGSEVTSCLSPVS